MIASAKSIISDSERPPCDSVLSVSKHSALLVGSVQDQIQCSMLMSLQEARELQMKALRGTIHPTEVERVALQLVTALEQNFLLSHKVEHQRDMLGCPTCGGYH